MNTMLRGLTLDIGGSEARSLPLGDTTETGLHRFSNAFSRIEESDFRVKDTEDRMELMQVIDAPREEYKGIIANGMTCNNYKGTPVVIGNQKKKTSSPDYYLQTLFVIAADAMRTYLATPIDESRGTFGLFRGGDVFDYVITTCIPVKEHSGSADCASILKAGLEGMYRVKFPLLATDRNEVRFRIQAVNVGVVPEGSVCITALRDVIGPDDISIVIDIGHVTMDMALFKGKQMFGSSIVSSQFSGGTLINNIKNRLYDEGLIVSEAEAQRAMETGFVRKNSTPVDVSHIVCEQKKMFVASYIKPELIGLLNSSMLHSQQVQNIIPIGGPMNEYPGLGSMAEYILKECDMMGATVRKLADDLRYVNITQASIFTKVLYNRAMKMDKE